MQGKRIVKVSFDGETKRLKLLNDSYEDMVTRMRKAFRATTNPKVPTPNDVKFFYLDDENEIISITSQADFSEALEIEDIASLKLVVAKSASEARQYFLKQFEEGKPLAESLDQSMMSSSIASSHCFVQAQRNNSNKMPYGMGQVDPLPVAKNMGLCEPAYSDFEHISNADLLKGESAFERADLKVNTHEIACGNDQANLLTDIATDVQNLIHRNNAGCNTARVTTETKRVGMEIDMVNCASQASKPTMIDTGCDGLPKNSGVDMGQQVETAVSEAEVSCHLIIPEDGEQVDENGVPFKKIICYKCEGSQVNNKGLPCRKCKGQGELASKELAKVSELVDQEVRAFCQEHFKTLFRDYILERQEEQAKVVHESVICDGCDVNPIQGIRYHCSVCADYDICEKCEANGIHQKHALLKIRQPNQAPNMLLCQYKNSQPQPQPQPFRNPKPKQPQGPFLSGRFVKESIADNTQVFCGRTFFKTWIFRNNGTTDWPKSVKLVRSSGDEMGQKEMLVSKTVKPEEEVSFMMRFEAPIAPGRYTSFFRLQDGNTKFGQKVWCTVQAIELNKINKPQPQVVPQTEFVRDTEESLQAQKLQFERLCEMPLKEEKKEEPVVKETKEVQMKLQESVQVAAAEEIPDKEGGDDNLMQSQLDISILKPGPKQIYMEKVEMEKSQSLKEALTNLYNFGFLEFEINKALMLRHKDVNVVAEQLCSGALTDKQLNDIFNEK